jgi:hypothetical protein
MLEYCLDNIPYIWKIVGAGGRSYNLAFFWCHQDIGCYHVKKSQNRRAPHHVIAREVEGEKVIRFEPKQRAHSLQIVGAQHRSRSSGLQGTLQYDRKNFITWLEIFGLCHSLIEESVVKEGAGDRFAVGLTDARLPQGWPPCVANSFNDVVESNGRFFFG